MRISQYLKHDQNVKSKAPFVKSSTNTAVQFNYCTMKLKRTANNSITRIHIWRFGRTLIRRPLQLGNFF